MNANEPTAGQGTELAITGISAVSLATHDMAHAVRFYRSLGFALRYGGESASFTSFSAGAGYLNLMAQPAERQWSWWGRVILGLRPHSPPRDAPWGERYFHLTDTDGHEVSFAKPIQPGT